jgi:CheY-like chemotaxis protein
MPMIALNSVLRMFPGAPRSMWLKPVFLLLATVLPCLPSRGASFANMYETPPPRSGSVQQLNEQQSSQQRQESYRKQLVIPNADSSSVSRDAMIELINGKQAGPHPAVPPPRAKVWNPNPLLFTAAIILAVGFLIRRFAPELYGQLKDRGNAWRQSAAETFGGQAPRRAKSAFFDELAKPPVAESVGELAEAEPPQACLARMQEQLAIQRRLLNEIRRETNDAALKTLLVNLGFSFGLLNAEVNRPEDLPILQLASAAEGLLKELSQNLQKVTPSALRTLGECLNTLEKLRASETGGNLAERPYQFLVVDADLVSCRALSQALAIGAGRPDFVVNGETALAHANTQTYDVIFMEVQMPDMDGFDLCTQIRNSSLNQATPIIFVTSWSGFDARMESALCGGSDLIAKPFSNCEVTLKVLTHTFEARLAQLSEMACEVA